MSHAIELPDDLYLAVAEYAAQHGLTPEEVIRVWATAAGQENAIVSPARIDDVAFDPWAGLRSTTELVSADSLDRHDTYLAQEALGNHESNG